MLHLQATKSGIKQITIDGMTFNIIKLDNDKNGNPIYKLVTPHNLSYHFTSVPDKEIAKVLRMNGFRKTKDGYNFQSYNTLNSIKELIKDLNKLKLKYEK